MDVSAPLDPFHSVAQQQHQSVHESSIMEDMGCAVAACGQVVGMRPFLYILYIPVVLPSALCSTQVCISTENTGK
jgi:hypothetical protein